MSLIGIALHDGDEEVVWMVAFLIKKRLYDRLALLATEQLIHKSVEEVTEWLLAWKPIQADFFNAQRINITTH